MALQYEWEIMSLYTEPSRDGLENVVKKINWRYQVTDGANYGDTYGVTELPTVSDSSSFTAYADLSEDTIISWIKANDDFDAIKAKVDEKLTKNKTPEIVEKATPWDKTDTYTGDEEYLIVWDNDPNDIDKIWGPFKWSSAGANKGLKHRGGTDFRFEDDIIMYRKGLLPTDAPVTVDTNIKLWKVDYEPTRVYDAIYEYLDPQTWDLSNGQTAIRTFRVSDKELADAKAFLQSDLSTTSFNNQISGTTITVQGQSVKVATTFVAQTALFQKWSMMEDGASAKCKLNETDWFTLTKEEIKGVLDSIAANLQTILDEEETICDQIKAATSLDDLKAIEMMTPILGE